MNVNAGLLYGRDGAPSRPQGQGCHVPLRYFDRRRLAGAPSRALRGAPGWRRRIFFVTIVPEHRQYR